MNYSVSAPVGARRNILVRLIQSALEGVDCMSSDLGHCHNHRDTFSKIFYNDYKYMYHVNDNVNEWSDEVFENIFQRGKATQTLVTNHLESDTLKKFIKMCPNYKVLYVHIETYEEATDAAAAWFFKDVLLTQLRDKNWPLDKIYDLIDNQNAKRIISTTADILSHKNKEVSIDNATSVSFTSVTNNPVQVVLNFLNEYVSDDRISLMNTVAEDYNSKQHYYKDWYKSL